MKRIKSSLLMLVLSVLLLPMFFGTKVSAQKSMRYGIDVSGYTNKQSNGTWKDTDWNKVKESGKDFVFIRCGYTYYDYEEGKYVRNKYKDGYFEKNLQGALDAGLDVGVYYVSQAFNTWEAEDEAEYAMSLVNSVLSKQWYYELRLPLVIDFEDPNGIKDSNYPYRKNQPSKSQFNAIAQAFCDRVEYRGFTGAFYTSKSHLETKFDQDMLCAKYPFWYARPTSYADKANVTFWQYDINTTTAGAPGKVDLDIQYMYTPGQVQNLQANVNSGRINVSWNKVPGVYGYEVYRHSSKTNREELVTTIRGALFTGYTDYNVENGCNYTYRVRAILKTKDGNYNGAFSSSVTRSLQQEYVITLHPNGGKIKSGNVNRYKQGQKVNLPTNVQRSGYIFGGWYTDKQCKKGRTTNIASNSTGNKTFYAKWTKINVGTPNLKSVKNNGKKQMLVSINSKVGSADGYEIRYSTNSNMKGYKTQNINKASTLNATVKKLQKGKKYYVQVYAFKKDSTGHKVYSKKGSVKRNVKINK